VGLRTGASRGFREGRQGASAAWRTVRGGGILRPRAASDT